MTAQLNSRDYEQLSAYLDGQLSVTEKARLEERMHAHQELRMALDEMRRMRMLLRQAPRRRAPRNFTLTPAMVQQRAPKKSSFFDLFPVLSFASAIATLALVVTVVFQLLPLGSPAMMTASAPPPGAEMTGAGEGEDARNSALAQDNSTEAMEKAQPQQPQATQPAAAAAAPADGARAASDAPIITWSPGAFGKGGGGGGGGYSGLVVPKEAAPSLPSSSSGVAESGEEMSQQGAQEQLYADVPPVQGTGPILGLPKSEEAGQYLEPLPSPLPPLPTSAPTPTLDPTLAAAPLMVEPSPAPVANDPAAQSEAAAGPLTLMVLQVLLGGFALITGLAAYWLWRRNH